MSYPQGYLYQPSASLALYSCPAYSPSVLSGPRTDELGRSSSGSAFSPYAGSTAFSAPSPGYNSHLQYGADPAAAAAAAAFSSYVGSPYDHTPGMAGSLGYHPYAAPLGSYPYGDPAYRKNATRDATATLKAWLNEHRKNPYPTKGEKIMLAIITKMTLTQVSTWFANARRRLKKENKMTWTPRNRSEDEEDEENIDLEKNDEEEPQKLEEKGDPEATEIGPSDPKAPTPGKEADCASSDSDCKESPDEVALPSKGGSSPPPPPPLGPSSGRLLLQVHHHHHHQQPHHHHHHHHHQSPGPGEDPSAPHPLQSLYRPPSTTTTTTTELHQGSVIHSPPQQGSGAPQPQPQPPPPALSKPKLWSLAEIATSGDKGKEGSGEIAVLREVHPGLGGGSGSGGGGGSGASSSSSSSSPTGRPPSSTHCPFPNGVLSRPLYYTAGPFYPGYTNYGSFGALHAANNAAPTAGTPSSPAAAAAAAAAAGNGLNQTLLSRAEALAKESKVLLRSQPHFDPSKDSPYELSKKGTSHI